MGLLIHGDYFFYLGDFFLEDSFDSHFHRHSSTGAALAGALESNFDGVVGVNSDELNIATVAFKAVPNGLYCVLDLFFHSLLGVSFAATAIFTHNKSPINLISGVII